MTYDLLLMTLNDLEEFFQHVHTFQNYTTELIKWRPSCLCGKNH